MAVEAGADFVGGSRSSPRPRTIWPQRTEAAQQQEASGATPCSSLGGAGMIMWPKAKRAVSDATARHIADVVKEHGKLPVGVFVDEQPDVIIGRCGGRTRSSAAPLVVQEELLGDGQLSPLLPGGVLDDDVQVSGGWHPRGAAARRWGAGRPGGGRGGGPAGHLRHARHARRAPGDGGAWARLRGLDPGRRPAGACGARPPRLVCLGGHRVALVRAGGRAGGRRRGRELSHDGGARLCLRAAWAQGGSGQALEWEALQPPMGVARKGWLLAGGLKPENVKKAVRLARPTGVDVSSGVCGPDGESCTMAHRVIERELPHHRAALHHPHPRPQASRRTHAG